MLTGIIVAEMGVIAGNEIIARIECFVNVWLTRLLLLTTGIIELIADNGGYCSRQMGVIVNEHYCCWQRELLLTMVITCNKNNAGNGSYILLTLVVIVNVKYCYC